MKKLLFLGSICFLPLFACCQIELNSKKIVRWEITPLDPTKIVPGKKGPGMLEINFHKDSIFNRNTSAFDPGKMKISRTGYPDILLTSKDIRDIKGPFEKGNRLYPLDPGIYQITLNNVLVENVPIEADKKTRIKVGVLNVFEAPPTNNGPFWRLYKFGSTSSGNDYINSDSYGRATLPIGKYGLAVWGNFSHTEATIEDNQDRNIMIGMGRIRIIADHVTWVIKNKDESITDVYLTGGDANQQTSQNVSMPVGQYRLIYGGQTMNILFVAFNDQECRIPLPGGGVR